MIHTFQYNIPGTSANVQCLFIFQYKTMIICDYLSPSPDIDNPQFPSFEEKGRFQRIDRFKFQDFFNRHCSANDQSVIMRIHQADFAGLHHIRDQKVIPDHGSSIMLEIINMNRKAFLINWYHNVKYKVQLFVFHVLVSQGDAKKIQNAD